MEVRVIHLDPAGRPTGRIDLWPGHRSSVSAVCWSHDGRHLATAGYDGQVLLWDSTTGRPRHVLEGDGSAMWSVAVHGTERVSWPSPWTERRFCGTPGRRSRCAG
ncbi:WD40 repeat domain-containing protein [Streptomyces mirabilis]|uniref:WD40 repeat domain-containing protein n=1 Tax=Streptomyces mirabilis TaxID=68239 RepID=UPI0033199B12